MFIVCFVLFEVHPRPASPRPLPTGSVSLFVWARRWARPYTKVNSSKASLSLSSPSFSSSGRMDRESLRLFLFRLECTRDHGGGGSDDGETMMTREWEREGGHTHTQCYPNGKWKQIIGLTIFLRGGRTPEEGGETISSATHTHTHLNWEEGNTKVQDKSGDKLRNKRAEPVGAVDVVDIRKWSSSLGRKHGLSKLPEPNCVCVCVLVGHILFRIVLPQCCDLPTRDDIPPLAQCSINCRTIKLILTTTTTTIDSIHDGHSQHSRQHHCLQGVPF